MMGCLATALLLPVVLIVGFAVFSTFPVVGTVVLLRMPCLPVDIPFVDRCKPKLSFRKADDDSYYVFEILQIADIHLGEDAWTDWGPEQDRKTFLALESYLSYENPDLIVLTGDQLTANNVDANATIYYDMLARKLTSFGVPWATVFGNHDDAPLEHFDPDGNKETFPAKTSRRQLAATDQKYYYSLTQTGPAELFGTSNYWLDIHVDEQVAARIVMLDSGGGTLEPPEITQEQIEWFWKNYADYPDNVPVLAFEHIPSTAEDFYYDEDICVGVNEDGGVAPLWADAGIVGALATAGNVLLLGVGHNHGNDYCCKNTDSLHLCYGRHSGYGGYSRVDRGSRVYRLVLDKDGVYQRWSSYVRLETGEVIDEYDPSSM